MMGWNEIMGLLAMVSSDRWHGHVLRKDDSHILRRTLDLRLKIKARIGG